MLGLKQSDIGPNQVQIRRGLVSDELTTTKNGKERTAPIPTDLRAALDELAERRHAIEWVFPNLGAVTLGRNAHT